MGRFVPTKVIRVTNKDNWFDDQCSHAFGLKQEAHIQWTRDRSRVNCEEFVRCQVRANGTYSEAKCQFNVRSRDVLMMSGLLIRFCPLLSLLCSTWIRNWHRLLEVVNWCASRLVRLISSQIILTASSPRSLLICGSLAIRLRDLPPLPSDRVRFDVSC